MSSINTFYWLSIILLFFQLSCKNSSESVCTFPAYYGVAGLAESSLTSPWTTYENLEEVTFYSDDGDSVRYVVELDDAVSTRRLLCRATCPEVPNGSAWVEYDSEAITARLNPFLIDPVIELNTEKPGLIDLKLNSLIVDYTPGNVEVVDAINILINGLTSSSTSDIYYSDGVLAFDLRGNEELTSYTFFEEIELNESLYQDVYQTRCNECSNDGLIFYSHSEGIIGFMGPDSRMWYK